jgi:hypothetical protein
VDDLDSTLSKLGEVPVHPRLEGMDTRLVARIAADRRDRDLPLGASLLMIAAALGVGLVSGQATARQAAPQSVALDAGLDLAPSTRLVTAG